MTAINLSTDKMNQIECSTRAIVVRCAEITEACDAGCAARVFSSGEIRKTCDLCLDFMTAVGEVASADELRTERALFSELEDAVMRANLALAERTQENPNVVATIRMCEETLFRLLGEGDATVLVLAGLGRRFKSLVRQALHAFFTDIRRQLEASGDAKGLERLAQALASPLTTMLITKIKPILAESGEKLEDTVKHELRTMKKTLRRDYISAASSVVAISGPRTEGARQQVKNAVIFAASSKRRLTISEIATQSFSPVQNGYRNAHSLECWCRDNEARLWSYVDEVRLGSTVE